jgi:hypothetical protein
MVPFITPWERRPLALKTFADMSWGRDILVAPVTEPGAGARMVYLPNGTAWLTKRFISRARSDSIAGRLKPPLPRQYT